MATTRINITIDEKAHNLVKNAAKYSNFSISKLVSELILQKLSNPVKILEDENKKLAIQINENRKKIKELENVT